MPADTTTEGEPVDLSGIEDIDIDDLAKKIAPGLVAEMGRWPTSNDVVAYLDDQDIAPQLGVGELEALVDALKDIAPTYTITAS